MKVFQTEIAELAPFLEKGAVVLTPNHRMSVQLQEAWAYYRSTFSSTAVYPTPAIYAIDVWLQNLLTRPDIKLLFPELDKIVLVGAQELLLWKQVISQSATGSTLLNLNGTALNVMEAWRLMQQWLIPVDQLNVNPDSQNNYPYSDIDAFLQWQERFTEICEQKNLVTVSMLIRQFILMLDNKDADTEIRSNLTSSSLQINTALHLKEILLPEHILLSGFDTPPPLYKKLFSTLAARGTQLDTFDHALQNPLVKTKSCLNYTEEINRAARWARCVLKQNSQARIAIVTPALLAEQAQLKRSLQREFNADNLFHESDDLNPPWYCSVNHRMILQPLIAVFFELLACNENKLELLKCCELIRSAFLAGAREEEAARTALEFRLRDKGEQFVSLTQVRQLALQENKAWHCPLLAKQLLDFDTARRQQPRKQTCLAWSDFFISQITLVIDAQIFSDDSRQLHSVAAWYSLLENFRNSSFLLDEIPLSTAFNYFRQMAISTAMPPAPSQRNIEVVSPTEATGLSYTHVWCMHLNEQYWPGELKINPFIPLPVQRKYEIPDLTPEQLYSSSSQIFTGLRNSTEQEVVFSYAVQNENLPAQPSALLAQILADEGALQGKPENLVDDIPQPESACIEQFDLHPLLNTIDPEQCVHFEDGANLALASGEQTIGGTSLIANQARCPFRAFALQRLKCLELRTPQSGIPAFALGNCIHRVLELFWQEIRDSARLASLDNDALEARLSPLVDQALQELNRAFPHTCTPAFLALEKIRLLRLLSLWVAEEKKRRPFTVIDTEHEAQWQHASLQLQFRIDRLEQFEDGSIGISDYKTGKYLSTNWLEERQENPQLQLYLQAIEQEHAATGSQTEVNAVFYAQVNIENPGFKGITSYSDDYPKSALEKQRSMDLSWEELKNHWETSLAKLAEEYLQGYCAVSPKSEASCNHCHLDSFCRIQEVRLLQ